MKRRFASSLLLVHRCPVGQKEFDNVTMIVEGRPEKCRISSTLQFIYSRARTEQEAHSIEMPFAGSHSQWCPTIERERVRVGATLKKCLNRICITGVRGSHKLLVNRPVTPPYSN